MRFHHVLVMTATLFRGHSQWVCMVTLTSLLSMSCHRWKPIQTVHRFDSNRLKVWKFIRDEIGLGHKFILSTRWYRICKWISKIWWTAMKAFRDLLPDYSFYFTERWNDKDAEMKRFSDGKLILWSLQQLLKLEWMFPASVMIIESAERFGLSQLHQLRVAWVVVLIRVIVSWWPATN
jgi:ATP-dependent DNA helicase RecG